MSSPYPVSSKPKILARIDGKEPTTDSDYLELLAHVLAGLKLLNEDRQIEQRLELPSGFRALVRELMLKNGTGQRANADPS